MTYSFFIQTRIYTHAVDTLDRIIKNDTIVHISSGGDRAKNSYI